MKKFRSEKPTLDKPAGRTLHILNIPPYADESSLKAVFEVVGKVDRVTLFDSYESKNNKYKSESVIFKDEISSKFKIAYLVFRKSDSIDLLMKLKELPPLNSADHKVLTGIDKWVQQNNERFVDADIMQAEIDAYMKNYDKMKKAEEDQEEGADDDGWQTVSRKGFKQKESVINRLEQKIQKQKIQAKNLKNFYTFELRESKRQHLFDLRKRFQEDKRKMETLRQTRRFILKI
jgi:ribosomal RNA-processing protein 7